jgi:NADH-quinone oxidoreductase subunit L
MNAVYVILLLPLIGFGILLCGGKYLRQPAPGVIATIATGGAFVASVVTFFALLSRSADDRSVTKPIYTWIQAGNFRVKTSLLVDPLSVTMVLFVTGVSTLIHLYSIGYMKGDPRYRQFFIYLNLFVFSMVTLVLADNFLFLFLGWDGVALCSYLLVSFWFERNRAAVAGKKAFVTNRVADVGLMVAMFLVFSQAGSLTYKTVFAHQFSAYTAGAIGILMFITACGKSAQLPLYVWLPDAMEGPTPVSALIHAATMVTAGVYLMARVSPILHIAEPAVLTIIAIVGCITALFAATIACAQDDIKKVLAYSTISQLGYMFLAVGSGAYVAALFHMITHAFFKACLFLGAGSVIHGMHDEQDMKRMGGLRKWMPITAMAFIVSWLAIAGIPPFSGFWSKDEILAAAWQKNPALYVVGALTAGLTAYYMTRQVWLTFYGKPRWREEPEEPSGAGATEPEPVAEHAGHDEHAGHGHGNEPHESPWTMNVPLAVLGVLAAIGGIINLPFGKLDFLARWLDPLLGPFSTANTVSTGTKVGLAVVTTALCVAGIGLGIRIWSRSAEQPKLEPEVLQRGWYVDDAYSVVFGEGGEALANEAATIDSKVIDGAVNGAAAGVQGTGGLLRRLQTGYVRNYALGITAGAVLVLGWALYIRVGS